MSEDEMKVFLMKFGNLKSFHLVKGNELSTKVFCEFTTHDETNHCIKQLNGKVLGTGRIVVKRCGSPAPVQSSNSDVNIYDQYKRKLFDEERKKRDFEKQKTQEQDLIKQRIEK